MAGISLMGMGTLSVTTVFVVVVVVFGSVSLPVVLITIVRFTVVIGVTVPFCRKVDLPFITDVMVKTVRLKTAMSCTVLVAAHCRGRHRHKQSGVRTVDVTRGADVPSVVDDKLDFFTTAFKMTYCSRIRVVNSVYALLTQNTVVDVIIMVLVLPTVFVVFSGMVYGASVKFLNKGG